MKIEFTREVLVGNHICNVGEQVDVDEPKGRRLIDWGVAVEVNKVIVVQPDEPARQAVNPAPAQARKAIKKA